LAAGLEARLWATQSEPRGLTVATIPLVLPSPMSFVDRLVIVAGIGMFRDAGVQVLVDLVSVMEEVEFEAGQRLYQRGIPGPSVFLILSGQVVADRNDPDIRVHFGPGSVVCGTASLGAPILSWEARALGKTRVIAMRLEDWYDMMEEHFDL